MAESPEWSPAPKLLSHEQVDEWMACQRAAGRRVGFTCGSFDLLHAGHAQYLATARAACDRLLVAVNSDASVARYKSPLRPIVPQDQRMFLIAALASVDAVTVLDDDRPLGLIERWKPDLYIKGGDYQASSLRSGGVVEAYGGKVMVIPSDFATSTSGLLMRIAAVACHAAPERVPRAEARGLVLVDRDGTIIRDIPFLDDAQQVELMPGAGEALAALQAAGFLLAIVTNQQGVGLGYSTTRQMIAVNQQMFRALGPYGVQISKIYYCPHTAAEDCGCRKPRGGMVTRALRDFEMDAARTFVIGDRETDVAAGQAAGCRTVLLGGASGAPDFRASGWPEAAAWITSSHAGAPLEA